MAIISFGKCNFNCLYCKRNGQFKNKEGNIIKSVSINWNDLKDLIDNAILKGQRIRLSGGDPCMFYKESLYIAKYVWENITKNQYSA
ncbi:4Fe-4S cluster-binding domain-containing protein [Clostridium botulinum]|uniref:4Fe-4S single cluster domain protein n=1 Tax=Clostridium botulinum TaxID=1491 RepID=A0A1L7JM96_CLOBO|nr:4Fe-4S cluster-binding domain-containing protein [Clostridium botulinum]APU86900.1 4Fe-4S single cluster domain protein [Clostridium botulinum]